ncbi:Zinc finger protein dzip1, partial [Quaeritorhiza haematococci]
MSVVATRVSQILHLTDWFDSRVINCAGFATPIMPPPPPSAAPQPANPAPYPNPYHQQEPQYYQHAPNGHYDEYHGYDDYDRRDNYHNGPPPQPAPPQQQIPRRRRDLRAEDYNTNSLPSYNGRYQNQYNQNGKFKENPRKFLGKNQRDNGAPAAPSAMGGFYFRRRTDRLNWRTMASIQVDRIVREVDIASLQEVIDNVTFCDIEAEDLRYADPNIVKLFQIAQLIIEYLLHSQEYLADTHKALTEECEQSSQKCRTLTETTEKQASEIATLKKETRALRKTLCAYQLVAKLPNGIGAQGSRPAVATNYY